MNPDDIYNMEWNTLGNNNKIHLTAIVHDDVELGSGNIIGPYSVIGSNGEIRGKDPNGFKGKIKIGNNNIISEHVTIQRPFDEGSATTVGNNNIIMAHSHLGHDVTIGDDTEICTSVVLGGYSTVKNGAKIKIGCLIRNRIIIGENSIVGMGSVVTKNVDDDSIVYGNPAKIKNKN